MLAAAGSQTHGGSQVAAGAVAAYRDAFGIHMQAKRICRHPLESGLCIVVGRREHMLRRKPVVDRKHGASAGLAQLAAQHVVGVYIAYDPAAAVVVDQCRKHSGATHTIGA